MSFDHSMLPARSIFTSTGTDSKFRVHHEFGTERAGAKLRRRQIQIVRLLKYVIRKFVAARHSDAPRLAIGGNRCKRLPVPLPRRRPRRMAGLERVAVSHAGSCPCLCKTTPARCRSFRARAGRLRRPSGTFSCCRSGPLRSSACMLWRLRALPRWVKPVPETRQRAGSVGMVDGRQNSPVRSPVSRWGHIPAAQPWPVSRARSLSFTPSRWRSCASS